MRPYQASEEYREFWLFVKSKNQSEYSFPSGHTTVAMVSMTALFFTNNKKWSWVFFLFALLMGFARVYKIFHYTTDVVGGFIIGGVAGTISYLLVNKLFNTFSKNTEKPFCAFVLNADLYLWIKGKLLKNKGEK